MKRINRKNSQKTSPAAFFSIVSVLLAIGLAATFTLSRPIAEIVTLEPSNGALEIYQEASLDSALLVPEHMQHLLDGQQRASLAADSSILLADESLEILFHQVRSGETLTSIWNRYGGQTRGAVKAASAFKEAGISVRSLRTGETLELTRNDEGDIIGLKKDLNEGRILLLEGDSHSGYVPLLIEQEIIEEQRIVSGTIESSFAAAAYQLNVPHAVIDELVDVFGGRVEFRRDLRAGDSFSILFTERRLESGEVLSSGAVSAASLMNNGRLLAAIRHGEEGKSARYYDENGEPLGNYFLRYPLNFTRISSVFSDSRMHPVARVKRPHNGVDFAAPTGTPVRTVGDGVVIEAGFRGGAGNMVRIRHNDRFTTEYFHLSRISPGITKGARVTRGQLIGAVGMTGLASGPHLHFGLFDRGRYVDPLKANLPRILNDDSRLPAGVLKVKLDLLKEQHEIVQLARRERSEEKEQNA